jgi:AcrR family transcriptional regulator
MPKLWEDTIDAHRREVRGAILDSVEALASEQGLVTLSMSQIAERTGIGRATLYKYFPDVEAVLSAWHERHVAQHVERLAALAGAPGNAEMRLTAVLEGYVSVLSEPRSAHGCDLSSFLHADEHASSAEHDLIELLDGLIEEASADGAVRDDVDPAELTNFCMHALAGARGAPSTEAARRLATLTMVALRPTAGRDGDDG